MMVAFFCLRFPPPSFNCDDRGVIETDLIPLKKIRYHALREGKEGGCPVISKTI